MKLKQLFNLQFARFYLYLILNVSKVGQMQVFYFKRTFC